MVYFVGAGAGAPDLITVRGMRLLEKADVIIYAGSLVNPQLLSYGKKGCETYNSAYLTLEEVIGIMKTAQQQGKMTVRLHTGDPSVYGAVREQMDRLDCEGIPYESCPGVSACFGAAAALNLEYTLPGVSQSLIITRLAGRTGVPQRESLESLAAHQSSMAIYLSAGMIQEVGRRLLAGGTPRRRWSTRPPGRRKRSMCVPLGLWAIRQRSMGSRKRPWCWWGKQWAISVMSVHGCMRRIFQQSFGRLRSENRQRGWRGVRQGTAGAVKCDQFYGERETPFQGHQRDNGAYGGDALHKTRLQSGSGM